VKRTSNDFKNNKGYVKLIKGLGIHWGKCRGKPRRKIKFGAASFFPPITGLYK
jgi:hypothetical protein